MDKQTLTDLARRAIADLGIESEVAAVYQPSAQDPAHRPAIKDQWCIEFTGGYAQFCDDFLDERQRPEPAEVAQEKIQNYLRQRLEGRGHS